MKTVKEEDFVVFGAGLPRTGTTSLFDALEILLEGKSHNMMSFMQSTDDYELEFWTRGFHQNNLTADDWKEFVERKNLRSAVDFPVAYFWRDLLTVFPNAKVILGVRKPEAWFRSVRDTIFAMTEAVQKFPLNIIGNPKAGKKQAKVTRESCEINCIGMNDSLFGVVRQGEAKSVGFFNRWNEDVIKTVPKERLLIHDPKDGWEPICRFLDKPVPNVPYPRKNDGKEMIKRFDKIRKGVWTMVFALPAVIAGGLFYMISYYNS